MFHKILPSLLVVLFLANLLNANNNVFNVASWDFGNYFFPNTNEAVKFHLKFFAPANPGKYPVSIFLAGLNGLMGSGLYTSLLEEIVKKTERIVIAFDGFRFPLPLSPDSAELFFTSTLNWTVQNMNGLFNMTSLPTKGQVLPDLEQGISLMSHSAGGRTLVSYLDKQCGNVKSLVLLEPVDGRDPFGNDPKDFVTKRTAGLSFAIPSLIVASGLGSGRLLPFPFFPSCAPSDRSNHKFYESLSGPTWYMNFTQYGHGDLLIPNVI